jgi:hypothetical protein
MTLRPLALALAVAAFAPPLAASAAPPAPSAENAKTRDIRRLLVLTGSGNLGKQVATQLIASFQKAIPDVPASFWEEFAKEIDANELVELIVPIYDRHFSHDEVKAIIAFYESPAGRKLVSKLPEITQDSMGVGQAWGQKLGARVQARLRAAQEAEPEKQEAPAK